MSGLLAVDVGNTQTALGLYEGGDLARHWRLATEPQRTGGELGLFLGGLLVLGPGTRTGIPMRYDDPREVGPDRIANAVAVRERYGAPSIVVDFGTSTNFDVVSADGEYVGGVLAPGIEVSMDALFERAARLVKAHFVAPAAAIGHPTESAL